LANSLANALSLSISIILLIIFYLFDRLTIMSSYIIKITASDTYSKREHAR
jgi:hypothetical protein